MIPVSLKWHCAEQGRLFLSAPGTLPGPIRDIVTQDRNFTVAGRAGLGNMTPNISDA